MLSQDAGKFIARFFHIICCCSKEFRNPTIELNIAIAHHCKKGETSSIQIARKDYAQSNRINEGYCKFKKISINQEKSA